MELPETTLAPAALMRLQVPRAPLAPGAPSGSLCPPLLHEIIPEVQDYGPTERCRNWQEQASRFQRQW